MKIKNSFKNKKIIITGHTGFKGSWLSLWLYNQGAKVIGISKNIPSNPSHFKAIKLSKKISDIRADIRNLEKLKRYKNNSKNTKPFCCLVVWCIVRSSFCSAQQSSIPLNNLSRRGS